MIRCTGSQETKAAPAQRGTAGQNPMAEPLSQEEMDRVYALPYMRGYHPSYEALGGVDGIKEIVEKSGNTFALLENYTDKLQLLDAVADADAIIIRSDNRRVFPDFFMSAYEAKSVWDSMNADKNAAMCAFVCICAEAPHCKGDAL